MKINELEPKVVWENFYQITRIPRPSKHEEQIRAYLLEWGKKRGIETFADETGNVIMRISATPGYENRKGVILQGHMDMVPQKNSDKVHDFEKDPIETYIDGEWVKAQGTTLGADNGLGLALALAVLESPEVKHGPIEVLATYDEETGMTGARALKAGVLQGDILINLDSETEGELYVGCAGGLDAVATAKYERKPYPETGYACYEFAVKGCQGGHSGMDIILCRANANKVAARAILPLLEQVGAKLVDLEGGTLRNAIPREAFATLYIPEDKIAEAEAVVAKVAAEVKTEYAVTDPDCEFIFKPYECKEACCCEHGEECMYVEEDAALRFIRAILACPDGVDRMSDQMPGLVETSNNMAMVKIEAGEFSVISLLRSSVDTAKEYLATKLIAGFKNAGADVVLEGGYSGWAPNSASPILHTMKATYNKLYGKEPLIMAIHAGLECGILGGTYPNWDMVSFGPTLKSPHSPDERAHIPSVQKAWDFLQAVLEDIPVK